MQSLCQVLQEHGHEEDLLSNMTHIARKVAFDFQSHNPGHSIFRIMKKIEYLNIRNLE